MLFKNIKIYLILIGIFVSMQFSYSQNADNYAPSVMERFFFGGNLGLQLGTVTDIEVSPIIGYWLLPRVAVAAGPQYRYYKYYTTRASIVGGKAYTEYYVVQDLNNIIPIGLNLGLFIHLEDEMLIVLSDSSSDSRYTINTLFLGGGVSQPIGQKSSANFMALWAMGGSGYGYYNNPEIRIVFTF